jgi:hypothetical protein
MFRFYVKPLIHNKGEIEVFFVGFLTVNRENAR